MNMIKTSSFKSAWWLPGPHLQTLWPVLSRAKKKPTTVRQRLELADGDFIDTVLILLSCKPQSIVIPGKAMRT